MLEAFVVVDIAGSPAYALPPLSARLRGRVSLGCLALLAGCASGGATHVRSVSYYESHAHHGYNPPGPPSDPWGPYINEAAARFDVPAQWIRQVMRVESGGHEYMDGHLTVSAAGAMGLMQLEPATYEEMAAENGLGSDPFNPYNNIMAGAAYIHAMYQIYGSPGFLAAYNAGPGRLNAYINGHQPLPDETVTYVAMIAPHIQGYYPAQHSAADELALNTRPQNRAGGLLPPGFVPYSSVRAPEGPAPGAGIQMASNVVPPPAPVQYGAASVLSVSARTLPPPPVPSAPAKPPVMVASLLGGAKPAFSAPLPPPPQRGFSVIPAAMADTLPPPPPRPVTASYTLQPTHHSGWAIQVGAYDTSSNAKAALGIAELSAVKMLMSAQPVVVSVQLDGHTKYRARFVGLMRDDAVNACSRLAGGPTGCMVIAPEEQS